MRRNFTKFFCFIVLLGIIYISADVGTTYFSIPSKIVINKNELYKKPLGKWIGITNNGAGQNNNTVNMSENQQLIAKSGDELIVNTKNLGKYELKLNLFGKIPLKTISIEVEENMKLIPSGNLIGIKMKTIGVLVVGMSYARDEAGNKLTPAKDAGLLLNDSIISVNDTDISTTDDFIKVLEALDPNSKETINMMVNRNGFLKSIALSPIVDANGKIKIGAWVRDSTAGIGTMTFYDQNSNKYGALGHSIADVDTGEIINISDGILLGCGVSGVKKGEKSQPGEIQGHFSSSKSIGSIIANTNAGIFGVLENPMDFKYPPMEVASKFSVVEGDATILSCLDGVNVEEYAVSIERVFRENSINSKDMVIEIKDDRLLELTGGIIQGMSGSPILQNGKIVGAVTHVFINNPQKGYGIFIENMLDNSK